jgi:hypothetical protein
MLGAMTKSVLALLAVAPLLLSAIAPPALPAGTYTNEEDRYFAGERGAAKVPDWTGIEIGTAGEWRRVDAFGKPQGEWQRTPPGVRNEGGRLIIIAANGLATEVRRANAFRCWISMRRNTPKPDGSADWTFAGGLKLHDQGGRAAASDANAPGVVIRLRNVIWPPPSTNKPSLVLYVHKPEEPDKAVSYAWADPGAKLIGINLRWVQGSCSRDEPVA